MVVIAGLHKAEKRVIIGAQAFACVVFANVSLARVTWPKLESFLNDRSGIVILLRSEHIYIYLEKIFGQ